MAKGKFQKDIHHRRPKCLGGTDTYPIGNLSHVSKRQHAHWHALFGVMTPEQIVNYINRKWLDPEYVFVVQKKVVQFTPKIQKNEPVTLVVNRPNATSTA